MDESDLVDVERCFWTAIELGPTDRERYLEELEGSDRGLAAEVRSLIGAHESSAEFLARPASLEVLGILDDEDADGADTESARDTPRDLDGESIGGFRVLRHLGSGGMCDVYVAEQSEPRRLVALKVLRPDSLAGTAAERFAAEAETLARLDHPDIARVLGAGRDRVRGAITAWIAVEYVADAVPITTFVVEREIGIRERLRLFSRVCDAVHHAHRKGVLHRDLKPANLLVPKAGGRPKVIDFGLARLLERRSEIDNPRTRSGEILGTLHYMSPEQCAGDADALDVRTDVYSLGVLLYEMLTGHLPYEVRDKPLLQVLHTIRERGPIDPATFDPELRGDLTCILHKALSKRQPDRYDSVAALRDDVEHWLHSEPVAARSRQPLLYRLRLFARRRTSLCVGLCAASILTLASIATIVVLHFENERALEQVRREQANAAERSREAAEARAQLDAVRSRLVGLERARGDQPEAGGGEADAIDTSESVQAVLTSARSARSRARSDDEKRRVVAAAVAELDELAGVLDADVESRIALANAYRQIARLHGAAWFNLPADAENGRIALEKAVALWRRIVAERPADDDARGRFLDALTELAQSYRKVRRSAAGMGYADEAVGLARRAREADRADPRRTDDLVAALWARGDLHINLPQPEQGQRDSLEALAIADELLSLDPNRLESIDSVTWSLLRTGIWAGRLDADFETAIAHHARATDLRVRSLDLLTDAADRSERARLAIEMFASNELPNRRAHAPATVVDRLRFVERGVSLAALAPSDPTTLAEYAWVVLALIEQAPGEPSRFDAVLEAWRTLSVEQRARARAWLSSFLARFEIAATVVEPRLASLPE